ncbi:biphenyl 2,3-dioxygenase [Xenophilus aerolatus]|nr:biphenyl 2,3-dioxygenase [Xenophilus aerolatus]
MSSQLALPARPLPDATAVPIRPAKLAHVVLRVSDLARSRAWYRCLLEASVAFENEMVCFLSYDEEHHRLGLIGRPDLAGLRSDDALPGLEHVAFTYATLGELLATWRRLQALEITPYWCINHGPTISLYYKDPDGNRVELQYDVFASAQEVQAFFDSGAYAENFMGIRFDPAALAARFEAGEALDALTRRPPLPAGATPWDMHLA